MKIPNKQVLQQIAFNHLSDIEFKELMNCHKKIHSKATLVTILVINCTLLSENPLRFRKNLLERI